MDLDNTETEPPAPLLPQSLENAQFAPSAPPLPNSNQQANDVIVTQSMLGKMRIAYVQANKLLAKSRTPNQRKAKTAAAYARHFLISSHKVLFVSQKQTLPQSVRMYPIRYFSCGSVLAGKWLRYQELVLKYSEEEN